MQGQTDEDSTMEIIVLGSMYLNIREAKLIK
jgi:hypothetical protein